KDLQPVGLDDFRYSQRLNKLLVPAGRTGTLVFLDPATNSMTTMPGFGTTPPAGGGRGAGITSVDESDGLLLVTDRSSRQLDVIDPAVMKITASAVLAGGPDYVRYVSPTNEIWVTEPHDEQIEILTFPSDAARPPEHKAFIQVKGGPEALAIDSQRGVAYTNIDGGKTVVIDLKSKQLVHAWPNGCEGAEGALLDDTGKFLFVACGEGKVVSLDLDQNGKILSTVDSGAGIDIVAYNPKLRHLYAPGSRSATMGIVSVSTEGKLTLIKTVPTVEGGHCVASAPNGNVYVCDPHHGSLLVVKDE
ncbi:MAG TPA: hypothetical protein VLR94_03235, partial [Acidobacteriota bacterium]|nr:hypothetical protein [Acidobacteriota bacterium]